MHIPQEVLTRITAKIDSCIAIIKTKYNVELKYPRVVYKLKGRTAGTADYSTWMLDFNAVLLMENIDDFIARTVPHEVAHLACEKIYPEAHHPKGTVRFTARGVRRPKRDVHGFRWQSIMRVLGADPARCHTYDTTTARKSTGGCFWYKCSGCGHMASVGPKIHAQLQADNRSRWHKGCKGSALIYVPDTTTTSKPIVSPSTPKVPAKGTKLDLCYGIFENYPGATKSEMINHFIQLCNMTPAGASTYYYLCKNRYNG